MTRRPFDIKALRRLFRYMVRHEGVRASRLPGELVELLRASKDYSHLTEGDRALEIEADIHRCIKLLSEKYSEEEKEKRNYVKAFEVILKLTNTSAKYKLTLRREQAARLLDMSPSTFRRSYENAMLDDLTMAMYRLYNGGESSATD